MIDPIALATITSSIAVLGNEFVKGIASEAGKSTWIKVKSLFGWESDPAPSDLPVKISDAISKSPGIAQELLELLKKNDTGTASALVGKIEADNGKIVVANTINADTFQM